MGNKAIYYAIAGQPKMGGQLVNEAHVIALRQLGIRAYLLYFSLPESFHYFTSDAPVLRWHPNMTFLDDDIAVVPEPFKPIIDLFATKSCRKLIHCQNPYYMFHAFEKMHDVEQQGFERMLSCSHFTSNSLKRFGYNQHIHTVVPAIPDYFCMPALEIRKLQIAYMPRKRPHEVVFLKGLFKSLYPQYTYIEWLAIENLTREQCAPVLQQSAIFLALSFTEGLGLPPLEAMASGCVVVGFTGHGGEEYSQPDNGFWVDEGDYFAFVAKLAEAIECCITPATHQTFQQHALATAANYRHQQFTAQLQTAWQAILGDKYSEFLLGSD